MDTHRSTGASISTARRDRIAWWLANAALRIATPWYRNMIGGAIHYGLASAARDTHTGAAPPEPVLTPPDVQAERQARG